MVLRRRSEGGPSGGRTPVGTLGQEASRADDSSATAGAATGPVRKGPNA